MRSNPNRINPDFWCEFHNDHSHRTSDCRILQGEVEHLLKQGYLTELFSEKGKQTYMKNRQEPPKPPSPKRKVNMINGGVEVNGVTYTAARKTTKFTIIHGKRIRQTLEDGSSMNIILLRVVNEMLMGDRVVPKARSLSGFDNSTVITKGEIELSTYADEVIKETKFQVIDTDMAYNMILGRPWIHDMDAVPSTLHQPSQKDTSANQKDAGASEKDVVNQISREIVSKQTDVDSRPDVIQEPEEIENIKTTIEELEAVPLFEQWPDRRIHIEARYNMKLNPEKCAFGITSGKFLGFLVSNRGIEVNPAHIKAIEEIPDILTSKKEVQRLTVAEVAVSAVLVREDKGKQSPIYYVSKSLLDDETRYPYLEKLALALVMAARKLRPYFHCHPISIVTAYPLRSILHKQELSGRLAKWAIELSEYGIIYQPRTTVKFQVLADFVADFNTKIIPKVEKELQIFTGANPGTWTLFTDVSLNVKGAGLGIVLIPPSGESMRQAIKCYPITNNEAEYEVVIAGLELARELSIEQIMIKSDSQLIVNQMQGTYTAREPRMQQYLEKARELVRQFQSWKIVQIPREEKAEADVLANLASIAKVMSEENAIVIHLFHSTLDQDKHEVSFNNLTWDWRNEIVNFL
ncbi:uncharacterized protein [Nicotiana tomentosiformis]|uniref:uncharacterized protein n=1 Tax=Nicotiana tomentosiformis TaxID=4098 RepID=UPI00388CBA24